MPHTLRPGSGKGLIPRRHSANCPAGHLANSVSAPVVTPRFLCVSCYASPGS